MPNPSNGRFTIQLTMDNATMVDLVLLAPNGTVVERAMHRRANKGTYTFPMSLGARSASGYVVMARTNEGMLYRKVIVE